MWGALTDQDKNRYQELGERFLGVVCRGKSVDALHGRAAFAPRVGGGAARFILCSGDTDSTLPYSTLLYPIHSLQRSHRASVADHSLLLSSPRPLLATAPLLHSIRDVNLSMSPARLGEPATWYRYH